MEFAGAFNSAVLVRGEELTTIKGDRRSIGSESEKEFFRTETAEIKKDDMIYLFSDGYQDQFGGERGKKYMGAKFKKQLLLMI